MEPTLSPKELIAALVERGMTQEQIADAANTTQGTISKVLRGDVVAPSYTLYLALSRLYGSQEPAQEAA